MNYVIFFIAGFLAALGSFAQANEGPIVATGSGSTYRAAVNEALVVALEQHGGFHMSSTERSALVSSSSGLSLDRDGRLSESERNEIDEAIAQASQKWASGKIAGYTVLTNAYDPQARKYTVELEVRFPAKYEPPGRAPDALRRMVVTTFNVRNRNFAWHGQSVDSIEWVFALGNALNADLTQTRKFTMLDREYDKEVNAELARLTASNASPEDAARLNQKLAADYLIVGEVELSDVQSPAVNPMTGQSVGSGPALFATVNFRVLIAPTGQQKWSDTIRVDSSEFPERDLKSFMASTAEWAAALTCKSIMENILPLEVVGVSSGLLIIGEGGRQVANGQRFSVNALGEDVRDTRTGEVIDAIEIPVAVCEIVSVQPKLSYAKLISGELCDVKVGARLRPLLEEPPISRGSTGTTTTIKVNSNGGVVVPF
ncbi:MAG: hypothetical protein IJ173_00475 [Kiritimatiellae bacterium]|nr:hypothetical protein [Kiritimatiellia bacterium]